MPREIRSVPLRYGLALASFALILGASFLIESISPFRIDLTSLIIIAMIGSSWFLGFGPGMVLAVILELTLDYFTPPQFAFKSAIIIFNRMVLFTSVVWFASWRRSAEKKLRAQRELLQATLESEQRARRQAEAADRLKDEFLATVSHELRTPLSAILGWAAMLNMDELDEKTTRVALSTIERNAKAQAEIISDILDVSSIMTGKLRIDARAVELAAIVRAAVDTLQLAARAKGLSLSVSLDGDACLVVGDPDRLQQIVWNLVSNAIKFTPNGGSAQVRLERVNSNLELTVSDNGIGISSEFLPYVFERFRQADSSSTRAHGGLGLGLAIVRNLVELHGGTVSAESKGTGHGAKFIVQLPIATAPQIEQSEIKLKAIERVDLLETDGDGERPDLAGLRVLLVDDEPDTLEILRRILSQFGANVRGAGSTTEAMNVFLEWKPDVLVSDLGMPEEDGYALIQRVRALRLDQGCDIPAAALTAHVREEDRVLALAAGYQIHIKKPVDPAKLALAVANLGKKAKV
ncbi:MAG TPA: ATP-binding protein [Pyrinomonadaceae bacterium]|nr:ATP-binding protein [Pyrinomonadaceae bacterium]